MAELERAARRTYQVLLTLEVFFLARAAPPLWERWDRELYDRIHMARLELQYALKGERDGLGRCCEGASPEGAAPQGVGGTDPLVDGEAPVG